MAITKKSIVGKASAKHSTKKTAAAKVAGAMRSAKPQLQTTKTAMLTGMAPSF
jgi:hypothetical protein